MTAAHASRNVVIVNDKGLHVRAATRLVKVAMQYEARIQISRDGGPKVDGKVIVGLFMLTAAKGTTITLEATGSDAAEAVQAIAELVESGFYEE